MSGSNNENYTINNDSNTETLNDMKCMICQETNHEVTNYI